MAVMATPETVAILLPGVFAAGVLTGVAGFGFAVVGTMALAAVIDPATAVAFMIVPILSVNLSLARDLSSTELRTCGRRFGPLIGATLVGTVAGMAVLESLPEAPLRVGLGAISLGFVVTAQDVVPVPGISRVKSGCFVETPTAMVGVGGLSGLVFGATNVGVQVIAYLRSCDLEHRLFVGVVALVFLGVNAIRVGAAGLLGLYPSSTIVLLSVATAVPAVAGVAVGKRFRDRVGERWRRAVVFGLLTAIGLRLVMGGLGVP